MAYNWVLAGGSYVVAAFLNRLAVKNILACLPATSTGISLSTQRL